MKTTTGRQNFESELKILINKLPVLTMVNRGTKEEEAKRTNEDEPLISKYFQILNDNGKLNKFLQSQMLDGNTVQNALTNKRYQVSVQDNQVSLLNRVSC